MFLENDTLRSSLFRRALLSDLQSVPYQNVRLIYMWTSERWCFGVWTDAVHERNNRVTSQQVLPSGWSLSESSAML